MSEIELSGGPVSPIATVPPPMTLNNPPRNRWRTIACILWGFSLGFSDAAPGALLPHIEEYYDINYAAVSCIWVSNAVGFIIIALGSDKIEPLLGKQKALLASCVLSVTMYALVASGTVFPVVVIGFLFGGMGAGIGVAQTNVFLSRMSKKAQLLSFLHAAYGVGATISPIIATATVNAGVTWHFFYLILLGLYSVNGVNLFLAFGNANDLEPWQEEGEATTGNLKPAAKSPITWLLSLFILLYQGAEVAMAGWIVTFLLDYRHGNPSTMGYVASGFWGGLTIGRLVLTNVLSRCTGIRRGVFIVSILSIVFVVLAWVIPSVVAVAVLTCLAGIFIGPNYPLMVAFTTTEGLIPRKIQVITITVMTAFGSSGGALFPFLTGLISQSAGTYVIMPIFISLYGTMTFIWMLLPNVERQGNSKWSRWW
ncbi:bypass of stop codon protein 6 [Diutina catenulata]